MLQKWGWYLIVIYSIFSISINSYVSIMIPSDYNVAALFQALFSMFIFTYFLRREIKDAFFKSGFRGWRNTERYSIATDISVNGKLCRCINLSPGGCAVSWAGCPLGVQMPVSIRFQIRKKIFNLQGKIARISPSGEIGISFINLEGLTEKSLRELLIGVA